jgi:cell division protein FtsB
MDDRLDRVYENLVELLPKPSADPMIPSLAGESRTALRGDGADSRLAPKTLLVAGVVVAMVLYGALKDDEGVLRLFAEQSRLNDLRRSVRELRDENLRLREEVRALRQDPRAIEGLAREQLGLSRPGEIVFLIP